MPQTCNLGDALNIFEEHIPDIRKACVMNIQAIATANQPSKEMTDDDEFTSENIKLHINHLVITEKTEPLLKVIKRIDSRNIKPSAKSITDEDIARVREKPIEELYDGQLFGRKRKFGLCPFHNERTPSFYVYTDKNNFHCYGCDAHGSSIDFIMKRDGVDFITAVKSLRGMM